MQLIHTFFFLLFFTSRNFKVQADIYFRGWSLIHYIEIRKCIPPQTRWSDFLLQILEDYLDLQTSSHLLHSQYDLSVHIYYPTVQNFDKTVSPGCTSLMLHRTLKEWDSKNIYDGWHMNTPSCYLMTMMLPDSCSTTQLKPHSCDLPFLTLQPSLSVHMQVIHFILYLKLINTYWFNKKTASCIFYFIIYYSTSPFPAYNKGTLRLSILNRVLCCPCKLVTLFNVPQPDTRCIFYSNY